MLSASLRNSIDFDFKEALKALLGRSGVRASSGSVLLTEPLIRMAAKEKSQSQRFIEKAKELGADESADTFERAFKKVVPPKKGQRTKANSEPKSKTYKLLKNKQK